MMRMLYVVIIPTVHPHPPHLIQNPLFELIPRGKF